MIEDHTSLNKHLGACLKFLQKGCGGGGGKGTYNSSCVNSERNERFQKEALFMQLYLLGCVVKIQ